MWSPSSNYFRGEFSSHPHPREGKFPRWGPGFRHDCNRLQGSFRSKIHSQQPISNQFPTLGLAKSENETNKEGFEFTLNVAGFRCDKKLLEVEDSPRNKMVVRFGWFLVDWRVEEMKTMGKSSKNKLLYSTNTHPTQTSHNTQFITYIWNSMTHFHNKTKFPPYFWLEVKYVMLVIVYAMWKVYGCSPHGKILIRPSWLGWDMVP